MNRRAPQPKLGSLICLKKTIKPHFNYPCSNDRDVVVGTCGLVVHDFGWCDKKHRWLGFEIRVLDGTMLVSVSQIEDMFEVIG